MTSPEDLARDMEKLVAPPNEDRKKTEQNYILLATSAYLDLKIETEGQTPRLMEAAKDDAGNLLIVKYEKLTKPIWKKYRSKPECRPIHFISEIPMWVVEDLNATFLLPGDFEFLGAVYAQMGRSGTADLYFNEAMKSGKADALINAGVFRYNLGERGVIDNFKLAKRLFNKAIGILHLMPDLSVDDKYRRRKLCLEAVDEIDYRFASLFDKFFKFIIRLLTLHFETRVYYVGAADMKTPPAKKFEEMKEGILKKEFNLKVEATKKFLSNLQEKLPVAQAHLEEELQEIIADYGALNSPETLDRAVQRIGEFYAQNLDLLERNAGVAAPAAAATDVPDNIDDLCFELASGEDIDRAAAKYKLTSVGELTDLAGNPNIPKPVIAWLCRDKLAEVDVVKKLYKNPTVPDPLKKFLRHRHAILSEFD